MSSNCYGIQPLNVWVLADSVNTLVVYIIKHINLKEYFPEIRFGFPIVPMGSVHRKLFTYINRKGSLHSRVGYMPAVGHLVTYSLSF